MGEILLLDQNTINKIAAGEVVERPSAVVKELVENAIDAGATAVTVEIKGGGIELIRITDNGSGIEKEPVRIAFERHATSKIRSAEDLLSVSSLGFRGEALASISAVSQVELVTKTRGELTGTRYEIDGGQEKAFEEIGCPDGTTFVVRNLFYNVPARRKFLKSAQTEASYINDLVERLAVSHPDISFKFMNNNQLKLQTSGNGNTKDVIYHIYGRDITSQLLEVRHSSPIIQIAGFVAKPVVSRGNRNYMNYYINGRYIKSTIINKAIEEAYKPYTMQHRYPMTALQFQIDSQFIDVNVHPAKMEIRFTNGQAVYQSVYDAVSDVLAGKDLIPSVTIGKEKKNAKTPVPKQAPEPFEKKRKLEESASVGKQKLEAAKLLSKFEELEKKQELLREEKGYPVKHNLETQKLQEETKSETTVKTDTLQNLQNKIEKETIKETIHTPESPFKQTPIAKEKTSEPLTDTDKKENADNVKSTSAVHTEESSAPVITESSPKPLTKAEQQMQVKKQMEQISGMPVWDKTNSEQTRLFDTEEEKKLLSKEARKHHKIIGQLFDTYWLIEYEDKLFIIDQHAAHEKVLFERTMRSLEKKEMTSQMLQPPIILSLSMREEQALNRHKAELEKLGFEIESFGGREFSVRAVPGNLFGVAQVDLLTELLDSLTEDVQMKDSDLILEKVASMSCKAAVKGNMKLSLMEAEALIDELMELENPYHCPHGRPVIISMTRHEIEKKFKRIL